jgi:hypothetical protein
MAAVPIISDVQKVTWTPTGAATTPVDLSCYITEPPADEVSFDTVSVPTLCNPQASQVKTGERTLTLSLLWTDDWATVIEPLFGTSGTLTWLPAGEGKAGYEYQATWPTTYGMSAPFGEAIAVDVQLGVTSRDVVAATP